MVGHHETTPALLGQRDADAPRTQTRVGDGEGEDAHLDDRAVSLGIRGACRSRGRSIATSERSTIALQR
jgi:hypothetical protein